MKKNEKQPCCKQKNCIMCHVTVSYTHLNKKKITMCEKNKFEITEFERNNPFLIHAKLGAFLAKDKYKVEDPEILSAITWHTTGKEDMTLLEKIIYIADYIEPARNKAPHLTRLRKLAFTDIDECMYEILKDSMAYLSENPKTMDPMTEQAYHCLLYTSRLPPDLV